MYLEPRVVLRVALYVRVHSRHVIWSYYKFNHPTQCPCHTSYMAINSVQWVLKKGPAILCLWACLMMYRNIPIASSILTHQSSNPPWMQRVCVKFLNIAWDILNRLRRSTLLRWSRISTTCISSSSKLMYFMGLGVDARIGIVISFFKLTRLRTPQLRHPC